MSVIDEVKQKVDIVELVAQYVPSLKKVGKSFRALCPFHAERNPSFYVFPERQSWHCFGGCGVGGDIFAFIMKKENIDFGEALRLLARRAGVELAPRPQEGVQDRERRRLIELHEAAALYYHHLLLNSPEAEVARQHLRGRGVSQKSLADFQLGYSPDSWQVLHQHLTQRGFTASEQLAAGLVIEREGGGCYDRFRGRLMFPIRDLRGEVIGFGARALDDSLPKYLNSPQTPIFDKGNALYGIDRAKGAIRRQGRAIIVEGYTDVITAHQNGFENVVASLGTSLTERQVSLIKRLTPNLILALDADTAGTEATLRGIEVATAGLGQKVMPIPTWQGLVSYENILDAELRVAVLPPDKDPDQVIREDPQAWQELTEAALPVVDYALETVTAKLDLSQARDKSAAAQQLSPIIARIKDPVRQSHYLQKLARLIRVDERSLAWALRRQRPARPRAVSQLSEPPAPLPTSAILEEHCLCLLLTHPQLAGLGEQLSPEYFQHTENREVFLAWREAGHRGKPEEVLDASLREHLQRLRERELPSAGLEERLRELRECILRLRERWLRELKLGEELAALELSPEDAEAQLRWISQQDMATSTQIGEVFRERHHRKRMASNGW
ncbi:MAG TPA: DNA primase [Dehalococcoidia bacterium]|nr:DNA primase [Dehalococcoidia bacterium]